MYTEQQIKEIKEYAAKHVCTHYAVNADIDKHPKIYDRSEGVYVYDIHGNRYLDTFGSLLTTICGHNNQAIMDAMNEQFKKIDFFPNFGDDYCVPAIELAKRLDRVMPEGLSAYFFGPTSQPPLTFNLIVNYIIRTKNALVNRYRKKSQFVHDISLTQIFSVAATKNISQILYFVTFVWYNKVIQKT